MSTSSRTLEGSPRLKTPRCKSVQACRGEASDICAAPYSPPLYLLDSSLSRSRSCSSTAPGCVSRPLAERTITNQFEVSDKNKVLVAFLLVLASGELAASCVDFGREVHFSTNTQASADLTAIRALAAVAVVADTVLALTLVTLLNRRKSEFNFSRTNSMINRIMAYIIGTGLITGAFALVGLVMSIGKPGLIFRSATPELRSSRCFFSVLPNDYVYILILQILPMREL